ncbi:hypothetical protein [Hasllibacter sp. MH4015]|uniref:hypothetical protein n=1 Tax=Hasllibacter sp. MH4015 TaxID=2854029 RepID=UPI001CD2B6D1|nr:hypothetical protein [Hasllibacter sp. MH4015]
MERNKTNIGYLVAGGLFVATAAIHALVGGPEVNAPVQDSALDPLVRAVSAVVWHALTALFVVFGGAMIWTAWNGGRALVVTLLAVNAAFIALFLAIGIVALGTIWPMPQWVLFGVISGVMIWGLRVDRARVWNRGRPATKA